MMWKNINYKDIKDFYEINEYGTVRNRNTKNIIKPFMGKNGYLLIKLSRINKSAPI